MLGCKPKGGFTEQYDIFFGIGYSLRDLIPNMKCFWPEAKGRIDVDVWREVTIFDNLSIEIIAKKQWTIIQFPMICFSLTLADIKKMNLKNTIIKH